MAVESRASELLRLAVGVARCGSILLTLFKEAVARGTGELLLSRLPLARQRGLIADGVCDALLQVAVEGRTSELPRLAVLLRSVVAGVRVVVENHRRLLAAWKTAPG